VLACHAIRVLLHDRIKSIPLPLGSLFASLRRIILRPGTLLRTRRDIRRLQQEVTAGRPLRIVVGSAGLTPPGWIQTDIEFLDLLKPADWERFFRPDTLDAILAEHVWEHLTPEDGARAAAVCFTYLKPGGYLRLAVPDGFNPDPAYRNWVRPGGNGPGADDHKVLYDQQSLVAMLTAAGFVVDLLEHFDPAGNFHHRDWNPADGMIHRSRRFDERNQGGRLAYTSLMVDARKPATGTG
jgi:predicted SAM-dependent methyltransferase